MLQKVGVNLVDEFKIHAIIPIVTVWVEIVGHVFQTEIFEGLDNMTTDIEVSRNQLWIPYYEAPKKHY